MKRISCFRAYQVSDDKEQIKANHILRSAYINRVEKGETDLQLSSFIRIADALGVILRLDVNLA